jgi:hypothetical protein
MSDEFLAIYLNDHLAGALVAVELLQHLERTYAGHAVEQFATVLRSDIEEDRRELRRLMSALNVAESRARQATAWIAERVTLMKLRLDDWAAGDFRLFEALEALALAIDAKRALWVALAEAAAQAPALRLLDYDLLVRRAVEQRGRVEARRLETALCALVPAR